jgi:DNA-binding FadR family transcriptional regulator
MAEVLASEMIAEIVAEGWPVGAFLGSETDLMERHKVSRAVFREAIRLLEHHQVVAMRRGPGGGLFVTEPTAAAITDAAAVYLERRGLDVEHLSEIRLGLELALLDLVIEHLDDAGMARLRDSLEVDRATSDAVFSEVVHDVHAVIASLARNSLLELFAGVLVRLTWLRQPPSPWAVGQMQNRSVTEVQHSHAGIVEAIIARDRELARHRLRRHLVALGGFK